MCILWVEEENVGRDVVFKVRANTFILIADGLVPLMGDSFVCNDPPLDISKF